MPKPVPWTPLPSGDVGPRHRGVPPGGELASGDGTIHQARRNQYLALPRWRAPEPTALGLLPAYSCETPRPSPASLTVWGSSVSEAGRLRARPPRTPAQVAAGSALGAVWVSAGSLHPSAQGRGCLRSTRSSRRRPSPVARGEGGDTGWGGGNGGWGGEKRGARLNPRGGGGAESHGRGAGAFLPAQETSVQLTAAAAGAGEVARDCVHSEGLSRGPPEMPRVPLAQHTFSRGSVSPPGTRGTCLILV